MFGATSIWRGRALRRQAAGEEGDTREIRVRYEGGGLALSTGGKGGGGAEGVGGGAVRACRHKWFLPASPSPLFGFSGVDEFIPWSHCGSKPCSWLISKDTTVAIGPFTICY